MKNNFIVRFEDTEEEKLTKAAVRQYREFVTEKEKKKREKRKKKGKKVKEKAIFSFIPEELDLEKIKFKDDGSDLTGSSSKKKKEIEKDTYEYFKDRFKEELTLYDAILEDAITFEGQALEDLNKFRNSGIRNIKAISEMYSNVISAKKAVMDAVKERSNIKKVSSDFEQKQTRLNGGTADAKGSSAPGMNLLDLYKKIQANSTSIPDLPQSDSDIEYEFEGTDGNFDADIALEAEIESMMDSGDFSDSELNARFEHLNPTVQIIRNEDTGEWKFVAVDEFDNVIEDYILPNPADVGGDKIKFDKTKGYVEDLYSRKYKFFDVEDMMYDAY